MQIVSKGEYLHEMLNPIFGKIGKNISECHLLKSLPKYYRKYLYENPAYQNF